MEIKYYWRVGREILTETMKWIKFVLYICMYIGIIYITYIDNIYYIYVSYIYIYIYVCIYIYIYILYKEVKRL